jgi:trigger factor
MNAMREGIRQRITRQKVEYLQDQARDQALAILRERSVVHLPDALVEEQLREEIEDFALELSQRGLNLERFAQEAGLTREQLVEQLRQRGVTRLQNTFLLMALADREGIEVTESELDEVAESVSPDTEPEIRARMKSDPEVRQQIAHQLRIEYALQKLLDIVQNREQGD